MKILIFFENDPNHIKGDLNACLESVHHYSPGSDTVILGDWPGAVPIRPYEGLALKTQPLFASAFRQTACPLWFEWRGVKRWLVFLEFCRASSIDQFWTFDMDCLWFCNAEEECERYAPASVSVQKAYDSQSSITLGMACFRGLSALSGFANWLPGFLKNALTKVPVSFSDMYLWECFLNEHPEVSRNYLTDTRNGGSFDPNLCCLEAWHNDGVSKVLTWEKGFPHGVRNRAKERLKALHCWSIHKQRMAEYLKSALASA